MHSVGTTASRLVLPLVAAIIPLAAHAQITFQPVAPVTGQAPVVGAQSDLSHYLTVLSNDPDNIPALTGAGNAALELGDGQAALNFLGHAEQLAPQDGRIKAGLGSALVLMEQAETAQQFFYEAFRLGVPASDMAAYRGLAYDLTGDPQRAQQDYQLALQRREDPEVRRRLALSMAISGQRDAALAVIADQLRRQDHAAWRARAFILALTGDAQGATQVVESMMPGQAAAMAPFLARLPSLSFADRARAVHFGHFPGDPTRIASATPMPNPAPPRIDPITSAGQPDARQMPFGETSSPGKAPAVPSDGALAATRSLQSSSSTVGAAQAIAPPMASSAVAPNALVLPPVVRPPEPPAAAGGSLPTLGSARVSNPVALGPTSRPAQPTPSTRGLADIATLVARLSDSPATAKTATSQSATGTKTKTEKPAPKEPSRDWVQIARASDDSALAGEYRRIKAKAPKLFAGKNAWRASQGQTTRLLVGPFESNKEARDFVNQLAKKDVDAFSWTSAAGQEIKKLPTK